MPPIVLTILQILFLLLLYIFVARAVGAVLRDVAPPAARAGTPRRSQPANAPRRSEGSGQPYQESLGGQPPEPERAAPGELVVHATSGAPVLLPLNGDEITFGRGEGASVALADPYASDRHAAVYREGGQWLIVDLGSTNGTFLNQVKVTEPTPIAAGDQLGIGRTVVEVRK